MFRSTKLMLAVFGLGLISLAQMHRTSSAADAPIPLHIAVQKGLVDVDVVGRGAAAGDSIQVSVKRRGGANVTVSVAPGTVINPKSNPVQSMVLSGVKYKLIQNAWQKADVIDLKDNELHIYILEGYCRDIEKKTPGAQDSFAVTAPDDANAKVLVHAKRLGATVRVTQSAIWIQRSKLNDEDLRKQSLLTAEEIDAARKLLVSIEHPNSGGEVDVKVALDRIRQLAARNPSTNIKRGDLVELVGDDVEVKARIGNKTLGTLKKGLQLEVLGLTNDSAVIRTDFDGQKQRGLVKLSDLKLVKSATHPVLNAVKQAAGDFQLEVFEKIDNPDEKR